jgi:hypothetical protein
LVSRSEVVVLDFDVIENWDNELNKINDAKEGVDPTRTRVGNGCWLYNNNRSSIYMSSTFCRTVKLSQSSGDNKVDITIISSAGHKQTYSFRVEDNNGKPKKYCKAACMVK